MTEQDTVKFLKVIAAVFPAFQITHEAKVAWERYMGVYSVAEASRALDLYVKNSKSEFAPSISQIVGIIREQVSPNRKVFKSIEYDGSSKDERSEYTERIKAQYPDLFAGSTRK